MKKTFFLLLTALALGVMSCDRTIPRVDVVIINHGQMQFYNHATQKLTPYEAETDSVGNVLFDKSDHLFYTAAHQQALTLKSLDLTESHPQPKVCANWKMTLDQITDWVYGTGAQGMFLDESLENLYLMRVASKMMILSMQRPSISLLAPKRNCRSRNMNLSAA